ncbi:hypothetical protein [Phytohabitans aurantiacus]|jgi:hypothetical protein|uniref:Uncharacterized protein n=1 Tax=Phytohabitans aurantiacus TaxID=3016789 RepID=A0ABQ5R033_9ACTN|nr:hypothetical protein [Phytohabitans aurantiacus]GLH99769.1 hypothetical protein Pa4123_50450 [Phytohabitans aurantiacus]
MTRYDAAKLYLMGRHGADVRVAAARGDRTGCAMLLFRMKELASGVLPRSVVEALNAAYVDVADTAGGADPASVLAAVRAVERLEEAILPDWEVRARD